MSWQVFFSAGNAILYLFFFIRVIKVCCILLLMSVNWCSVDTSLTSLFLLSSLSPCCYGHCRRLSSEDGSVSSNGSGKLNNSKSSSVRRTTTNSSKSGKEELHKRSTIGEDEEKKEFVFIKTQEEHVHPNLLLQHQTAYFTLILFRWIWYLMKQNILAI